MKFSQCIKGLILFVIGCSMQAYADESLLPALPQWSGLTEALIHDASDPWQTPAEAMQLADTPSYEQTLSYLSRLAASDSRYHLLSIGKTAQQRDIWLLIASQEGAKTPQQLQANHRPSIFIQAGIHAGEIDGKDAGLMLLRDISKHGKEALLAGANIIFLPILNADGHERRSPYNRVNQRGPNNMGWRTTAQNLNLNRDYTKADTPEMRHLIAAINRWQPDLYIDVHVTDGEDYQYDMTYGFNSEYGDSPAISHWLTTVLKPRIDSSLAAQGHKGGPLVFGVDAMDFSKGLFGWTAGPRFSNGWGDVRQLPTILMENHSLKPFRQRVLGTYLFLETAVQLMAEQGQGLIAATAKDKKARPKQMVLEREMDEENPEFMDFLGMVYRKEKDALTGLDYIVWTGEEKTYQQLPIYWQRKAVAVVDIPKAFYVPVEHQAVIEVLQLQGITMQPLENATSAKLVQLIAKQEEFGKQPFEGHMTVSAEFESLTVNKHLPKGMMKISTDQPLGRLAVALLHPKGPDSLFAWGFFNQMFQQTEYIESYAMVPLVKKMLAQNPELLTAFKAHFAGVAKLTEAVDEKQAQLTQLDSLLSQQPDELMRWFYQRSPYYDQQFKLYPVLMEY